MSRRSRTTVAVTVCVLAAVLPSAAQPQALIRTVRGQVRKQLPDGRLISGSLIKVSIAPPSGSRLPSKSTVTGWDGFYYVQDVPPGTYTLAVAEKEKPPQSFTVDLRQMPYTDVPPIILSSPIQDYRTAYKNARGAIDQKDWSGAAHVLQKLLDRHPEDARTRKEQLRVPGNYLEPYRPHYYLGLALQNLADCTGALRHWKAEESLGTPLSEHREGIRKGRAECSSGKL
jgi:hypothetical protein